MLSQKKKTRIWPDDLNLLPNRINLLQRLVDPRVLLQDALPRLLQRHHFPKKPRLL
jgi:hypothetical protein